jgi:DNA topoisomerase-2
MEMAMRIKHFIDGQWVAYADYDNRRSLPHLMDGLKITQRKAICYALSLPKNEKPKRVSQFAAAAAADTMYHHGEASMISTVVGLGQDFPGANNYPLLEKHGQFGTRLSTTPGGPRYITTKLHANWDKFFKKNDQDIIVSLYDDEDKIEPLYYIPIIPMLLINGADGMGNGFKSSILNYSVESVVKAMRELVKYGEIKTPVIPYINGFTGTIEKIGRQVTFTGIVKIVHSTKLHVSELPPGYDNDKYKAVLNKLIDDKVIKDYKNHSNEDKWDWIIDCPRDTSALGIAKLTEKLGLVGKVSENFVCWGMDPKAPSTFETPEALITQWYNDRLKLYAKSLEHQISGIEQHLIKLDLKIRFIKWCLKNDFRKLTKAEFIEQAVAGVKRLSVEVATEFVAMPMYRITTDEVKKAELDIVNNIAILEDLESQTPLALMEMNLKGL